jgi:perosamine synthetase
MARLPEFIARRQEIAAEYDAGIGALREHIRPVRPTRGSVSNYYKYMAMIDGVDRADLKRTMREQFDVGLSGEVYETPCHLQPIFAQFLDGPLPQAEKICAGHICLPVSAKMTREDARYVLTSLGAALESLEATSVKAGG